MELMVPQIYGTINAMLFVCYKQLYTLCVSKIQNGRRILWIVQSQYNIYLRSIVMYILLTFLDATLELSTLNLGRCIMRTYTKSQFLFTFFTRTDNYSDLCIRIGISQTCPGAQPQQKKTNVLFITESIVSSYRKQSYIKRKTIFTFLQKTILYKKEKQYLWTHNDK